MKQEIKDIMKRLLKLHKELGILETHGGNMNKSMNT